MSIDTIVDLYLVNPTVTVDETGYAERLDGSRVDNINLKFYEPHLTTTVALWKLKPEYQEFVKYLKERNPDGCV